MVMGATTIGYNSNISMYWNIIKNLNSDMKLDLISRLSESLRKKKNLAADNAADKFYGAWEDDKSADELAEEIRASRLTGTRNIKLFD